MSRPKTIECELHGVTPETFVCKHLVHGVACGFHHAETEGDRWPDAWCDKCQGLLDEAGGAWTDESGKSCGVSLLCTGCYERAREKNRRVPPPFRPGILKTEPELYRRLVQVACAHCGTLQDRARERTQFHRKGNWFFDDVARTLTFSDAGAGERVVAEVELVGSFSTRTNTWMWAWGNEACESADRRLMVPLQRFGEVRGIDQLATAQWPAEEIDGFEVTQIAAYLLGAEAIYRAPMEHLSVFFLLRNLRMEPATV